MEAKNLTIVPLAAAFTVAVATVIGGAFYPGPRLVTGLMLVLVVGWFGFEWKELKLASEEWLLLAFVGWGAVSAVVVGMTPLASRLAVTGWLVAWCLWVSARRANQATRRAAASVMVGTAFLVVAGIALEAIGRGAIRVGGLLENPNIAASLLVVSVPLVWESRGNSERWWRWGAIAVLAVGVGLSGSRAGLLAMLAAALVLLPRGRVRVYSLATGMVAVAAILAWRFASQPDVLAWFRPAIWLASLRLWLAQPVTGVGPGGLQDAAGAVRLLHTDHVGQHQFLIAYTESSPLGLLVQTGIVGFGNVAVALIIWVRKAHRAGALASPLLRSALVGAGVIAAFHDMVTIEIVVWWWALVIGLLEVRGRDQISRSPPAQWTRVIRALVLVLIVLWGMVRPAWARWLWRTEDRNAVLVDRVQAAESWYAPPLLWRARELLREDTWTWPMAAEALSRSRRAVAVHPGASSLWMTLGHVHYRVVSELGAWPDSIAGARSAFERAAELEPHQPWPWLEWARLERLVGDLDRAAALTRQAVSAEPHAVRAWLFLARVELDRGQMESAREAFDRARASADLATRPGLKAYERELVAAPGWQFRELGEVLR